MLGINDSAQAVPSFRAHKEFIAVPPEVVGTPGVFAQGDLNGDGIADLVVPLRPADFQTNTLFAVQLGNADGSFQPPIAFDAGATSAVAVIADFNGDGKNDVALTTANGVSILLGDGKGGFGPPKIFSAGDAPFALDTGDFNGDKRLDLAVANVGSNQVSILLGKGDGTFKRAKTFSVGAGPSGIAIGDFNGDGHLDLAVTDSGGPGEKANTVAVLLGTGTGDFSPAKFIPLAQGPSGVAVSDFNHDGRQDVVVANSGTDQVSILLGNGDGTFNKPALFSVRAGSKSNLPF